MTKVELDQQSEEREIEQLKAWLPQLSGKERAFIKGASKALLYVQETQDLLSDQPCLREEMGNSA